MFKSVSAIYNVLFGMHTDFPAPNVLTSVTIVSTVFADPLVILRIRADCFAVSSAVLDGIVTGYH